MPPAKPKPSEIALEVKHVYAADIQKTCPAWPCQSFLFERSDVIRCRPRPRPETCKIHICEGDPVDVALKWAVELKKPVPVVNPCHEKRPGGDWEAGVMAAEECLCRRSNLYASLTTPAPSSPYEKHYPIPITAGILSPYVVVFRDGPEHYSLWQAYSTLPVISVPPVKRPKISSSTGKFSFAEEKELVRSKIKTILRIAAYQNHTNIVLGPWGCGPQFRNPAKEVAQLFRELLFEDAEFYGQFGTIVFAFDTAEGPSSSGIAPSSKSKSKSSSSSSSASSSSKSTAKEDLVVWLEVMAAHRCT